MLQDLSIFLYKYFFGGLTSQAGKIKWPKFFEIRGCETGWNKCITGIVKSINNVLIYILIEPEHHKRVIFAQENDHFPKFYEANNKVNKVGPEVYWQVT